MYRWWIVQLKKLSSLCRKSLLLLMWVCRNKSNKHTHNLDSRVVCVEIMRINTLLYIIII